jgi:hypothetical protein
MAASIAEFIRLLHQNGVGSPETKHYRAKYSQDADFQRRASAAEKLFQHRRWVLKELEQTKVTEPRQAAPKPVSTSRPVAANHG